MPLGCQMTSSGESSWEAGSAVVGQSEIWPEVLGKNSVTHYENLSHLSHTVYFKFILHLILPKILVRRRKISLFF